MENLLFVPMDLHGGYGSSYGAIYLADKLRSAKLGDFKFLMLSPHKKSLLAWEQEIKNATVKFKPLGIIGGNHLIVKPLIEVSLAESALLITFDAHLDIWDDTFTVSHGNMLKKLAKLKKLTIVVAGCKASKKARRDAGRLGIKLATIDEIRSDPHVFIQMLSKLSKSAKKVYLDFDCDVLSNKEFKSCAFPDGSLTIKEVLHLLDLIKKYRIKISMFDYFEFIPKRDEDFSKTVKVIKKLIEITQH